MPIFNRRLNRPAIFRRTGDDDIARIKGDVAKLSSALERHERRVTETEAVATNAATPDGDGAVSRIDAALADRLDELTARITALDDRVTAVSRELANQVGELGNDIESMHQAPPPRHGADGHDPDRDASTGEALEELHDSQTRLANEQARYQIAFRRDLATLAEQLKALQARRGRA